MHLFPRDKYKYDDWISAFDSCLTCHLWCPFMCLSLLWGSKCPFDCCRSLCCLVSKRLISHLDRYHRFTVSAATVVSGMTFPTWKDSRDEESLLQRVKSLTISCIGIQWGRQGHEYWCLLSLTPFFSSSIWSNVSGFQNQYDGRSGSETNQEEDEKEKGNQMQERMSRKFPMLLW